MSSPFGTVWSHWEIQCFRKYFLLISEVSRTGRCSAIRKPASLPALVVQLQQESLQIHSQKFYRFDWRLLIQIWLENRVNRLAEFWLVGDIYGQWLVQIIAIIRKNVDPKHDLPAPFFFAPLAMAVLTWAQPVCPGQQKLELPTKPIGKDHIVSSIVCCVHAAEGVHRDESAVRMRIISALHVQT